MNWQFSFYALGLLGTVGLSIDESETTFWRKFTDGADLIRNVFVGDAVAWARRTLESGMSVNEVDPFTIVMGKAVEHYTKAYANRKAGDDAGAQRDGSQLTDLLESMARLVSYVGAEAELDRSRCLPLPFYA